MGAYQKKEVLHRFVDWATEVQKDVAKISRKTEYVFEDELRSGNVDMLDFMNNLNDLYLMIDSLKNNTIGLIQRYESN